MDFYRNRNSSTLWWLKTPYLMMGSFMVLYWNQYLEQGEGGKGRREKTGYFQQLTSSIWFRNLLLQIAESSQLYWDGGTVFFVRGY